MCFGLDINILVFVYILVMAEIESNDSQVSIQAWGVIILERLCCTQRDYICTFFCASQGTTSCGFTENCCTYKMKLKISANQESISETLRRSLSWTLWLFSSLPLISTVWALTIFLKACFNCARMNRNLSKSCQWHHFAFLTTAGVICGTQ